MPHIQEGSPEPLDHAPGVAAPSTQSDQPHETSQPLMLAVPWLHPEMEPATLPAEARFFDPGVGPASLPVGTPGGWRPAGAPLSEAMASAFLRESAAFAREHGGSRGALNVNALASNDFYSGSALSIQSELTGGARRRDDPAVRCQQLLLLAWQVEEQTLELRSLGRHIQAGLRDLDAVLGVDDTDEIKVLSGERFSLVPEDRESILPWRLVLEAMLFFVPQGTLLTTSHQEIIETLANEPDCSLADFPGNESGDLEGLLSSVQAEVARTVHAPGWRLVGATRCPTDKPWLEREHFLICLGPDVSGTQERSGASPRVNPGANPK
ncbi:hypothetical protein [Desulfonatronum sp. SC1]|uniref:hypothetical protein n=1 Tax=Desulfonatronum sp. SC1 TaxID=2109626 RepID=UPI000D2FA23F|nr:hypothetical protein [Desulfonatronum sp. SC1]PTN37649.1 hypothetical protein C6366_05220 [Desulfonatronum sp. SC1]